MHGRYERQKPRKKASGGRIALIIVGVLVALIIAGIIAGVVYYNNVLNKINRAEVIEKDPTPEEIAAVIGGRLPIAEETEETVLETTMETVPETKPMTADDIVNILVVGQSARPGEDSRMADSTVLVTINKYTKTVTLSSVLRDALVRGPDYKGHNSGKIKFTTCYALGYLWGDIGGAMECLNQVMEKNFGVEVDYNVEVDFEMFVKFIDTLGTVEVELTQQEADYLNEELDNYGEAEPGMNSLDGYMALAYARMRKADGDNDSDIKRTARQRYLIERMANKLVYKLSTEGMSAVQQIINEMLPYVTTNMENDEITKLLMEVLPILPKLKFESGTCPVDGTAWGEMYDIYKDGFKHSVLMFDEGQNKRLMRAITEGEGIVAQ